jgi:hypothetical protein
MAKTKTEIQPAVVTTINPPKGKVARTSVTSKAAVPVTGIVETPKLTEAQEKEFQRLAAIRKASAQPSTRSRYGNIIVRLKGDPEKAKKLPPQARVILDVMDKAKKDRMSYNELIDAMSKVWDNDRYRQGPARIVQFYRARLQEGGHAKFED